MHNEYCGPNTDLGCEQTSGKIRVLLIEGVESQAQWLEEQLSDKSDRFECAGKNYQVALSACLTGHYHVGLVGAQLSDDSDGHAEGTEFIQELRRKECDMPLVYCATSDQLRKLDALCLRTCLFGCVDIGYRIVQIALTNIFWVAQR